MEIDELIVRLGAKLDEWFDKNSDTFVSGNKEEQSRALLAGFRLVKDLDRLKADGLAAIKALFNPARMINPAEYAESLVRGFAFAAKLADTLHDELLDVEGENEVMGLMNKIADAIEGISSGRAAFTTLLDDPNPGVRAFAGAYLIESMPDRVIPILHEIEDSAGGTSAGFNAHSVLIRWKLDGKIRQ